MLYRYTPSFGDSRERMRFLIFTSKYNSEVIYIVNPCLQFRCLQSMMLRISVRETFPWKRSMDIKGTKFVWVALKSASSNKPMIHIKENSE